VNDKTKFLPITVLLYHKGLPFVEYPRTISVYASDDYIVGFAGGLISNVGRVGDRVEITWKGKTTSHRVEHGWDGLILEPEEVK